MIVRRPSRRQWRRQIGRQRRAGYTLTELAVILSVVGLMLAIGLPSFSRYHRSTATRNAFRQLVLDLRLARQKALAEHHNFVAVFDTGPPGWYGVFADRDNDLTKDPSERWLFQRTLASTIGLDAAALTPADSLAFGPAGRLPLAWTGGLVTVAEAGGECARSLRAWPSGSIETLDE